MIRLPFSTMHRLDALDCSLAIGAQRHGRGSSWVPAPGGRGLSRLRGVVAAYHDDIGLGALLVARTAKGDLARGLYETWN